MQSNPRRYCMTEKLTFDQLQRKMQLGKKFKQGISFSYRNVEDITTHFKALNSGWSLKFTDDLFEIGGRVFLKATAQAKRDEEIEEATAFAELGTVPKTRKGADQMQVPQWSGAVSSYARKYAAQGLFAMGEEDVDAFQYAEAPATLTQEQVMNLAKRIDNVAKASGREPRQVESALLKELGAPSLDAVFATNFDWCVGRLEEWLALAIQKQAPAAEQEQQPEGQQETGRQDFDINNI